MRKFIIHPACLVAFVLLMHVALQAQIRVAITSFENQTDEILLDAWQRNLPDFLGSELGKSAHIMLLERNRLKELFAEMHLALSGFVEDSALVSKIGNLAGADVLISGVITKFENGYVILAHVTRVKTTEVLVERVEAPDTQHFRRMVEMLANNIRFRLTGEGQYQNKVSLKKYPTRTFLLSSLAGAVLGGLLQNSAQKAYDDYQSAVSLKEMDSHYQKANKLHKLSGFFYTVAGAGLLASVYCWIKNLRQPDLKAGAEENVTISYQGLFDREGARFAIYIHF